MRFIKPLDEEILRTYLKSADLFISLEDGSIAGGAGSAVQEFCSKENIYIKSKLFGIPDNFVEHASREEMIELTKTCEIASPAPDILNWSENITLYLSGGEDTSTVAMTQFCHKGDQTVEKHRIVQVLLSQDDAIHACTMLNGKLAYPINIDEFKTWKSR